jgi:ubiquinone/menaquinone biosynthesis C-methylase UbiE
MTSPTDQTFIAAQLRKPSGDYAPEIAERMDTSNEFLYDLTLDTMDIVDGDRILEIGFGSGKFMHKLLSRAEDLSVKGIDYSPEMVDMAKEYNAAVIQSGRLELLAGSSDALPFPNDSFDHVFCNMVIFFWDTPADHLHEVRRVLAPGGTFSCGFRTKASMRAFPFTAHGFHLYESEVWEAILSQNGFTVTATKRRNDPPLHLPDQTIQLESVCMQARVV